MRRIILSGVHCVGKSTISDILYNNLSDKGFQVRKYSLDNYVIYRNDNVFNSQIDRMFYGDLKIKEAEEEQPQIAIFDRTLIDNIIYSKCYKKFGLLSENDLLNIIRVYQITESRKHRLDATTLFLNPPIDLMLKNIKIRGREKGTILETDNFVQCLKKTFENYYQTYIDGRVIELNNYDDSSIIEILKQNDII